jgi:hypothetical protein
MSTDWGFRCEDCDETAVIGNMRDTAFLAQLLEQLPAVISLMEISGDSVNLTIVPDGCYYEFYPAVEFAAKHRALGHKVVVGDEYNRSVGNCWKQWICPHCSHRHPCGFPVDHANQCGPKP